MTEKPYGPGPDMELCCRQGRLLFSWQFESLWIEIMQCDSLGHPEMEKPFARISPKGTLNRLRDVTQEVKDFKRFCQEWVGRTEETP